MPSDESVSKLNVTGILAPAANSEILIDKAVVPVIGIAAEQSAKGGTVAPCGQKPTLNGPVESEPALYSVKTKSTLLSGATFFGLLALGEIQTSGPDAGGGVGAPFI